MSDWYYTLLSRKPGKYIESQWGFAMLKIYFQMITSELNEIDS
jgi:hypothetical protein